MIAPAAGAAAGKRIQLESLSSETELVSGGDVLVSVQMPDGMKARHLRVLRNGRDVTGAFEPVPGNPREQRGLVGGLREGNNRIVALSDARRNPMRPGELGLVNRPITGPLLSGPWQLPFACRTEDAGLGPSSQPSCSAPTQVEYRYMSSDNGKFKPLADPRSRPADLATTTTRDGKTVDFVVRLESGTINRSIYRFAVLAPQGEPLEGWSRRLVYRFGGGCSAGREQGGAPRNNVLQADQLGFGYAVVNSSLNNLQTACNDVLSAESAAMIKEHVIETLGARPLWTMGNGGSGGSIQQQMILQNYPGILDGIVPTASYPDNSLFEAADCELLVEYFNSPDGQALSPAQRQAITGMGHPDGCNAFGASDSRLNASEGCQENKVGAAGIYHPTDNPSGFRCSVFDSLVNIWGTSPATGKPLRALDNVGLQYGVEALRSGQIDLDEFIALNRQIGGFDDDGFPRAARTTADAAALPRAYATGRINRGAGGTADVPILDLRTYQDLSVNVHLYINTFNFRERLRRATGSIANHVMWRAKGSGVGRMRDAAELTMANWLDRIAADRSDRSQAEKVVANKPPAAVDACWTPGGLRVNEPAVVSGTGTCADLYSPHRLPDMVAGKPVGSLVIKCQLKPIDPAEYGSPSANQLAGLRATFPGGVCDWSKPGVGQRPLAGTWQNFGPGTPDAAGRKLNLKAERGNGKRAQLVATLGPCPDARGQTVRFERRARGKWRRLGSAVTAGRRCKATLEKRLRGAKRVRAIAEKGPTYDPARATARPR